MLLALAFMSMNTLRVAAAVCISHRKITIIAEMTSDMQHDVLPAPAFLLFFSSNGTPSL